MGDLLKLAGNDLNQAKVFAKHCGSLMALEVQAVGIDISFAPVLDINGISDVIGNRAFSDSPEVIALLASCFIEGMNAVGMLATGKHFPGHGSVKEDSHIALPIDRRSKSAIFEQDLLPFKQLIAKQSLGALMPAHVIFPEVDEQAVGFSPFWLQQILRQDLAFDGVIFSDDLSMEGAGCVGGYIERAEAAQHAGCDMLLTCNNRADTINVIDKANIYINQQSAARLKRLINTNAVSWKTLKQVPSWQDAQQFISQLC